MLVHPATNSTCTFTIFCWFLVTLNASLPPAAAMQDGGQIMLDPYLCDALFKGVLKKGDAFPTHLPKRDVADAFLKRMLPQQRLSRGPLQVLKKGNLPQVTMQTKTRSGNKKVTCVQGLEVGNVTHPWHFNSKPNNSRGCLLFSMQHWLLLTQSMFYRFPCQ